MLLEILKRTPPWVFVLFFILVAVGYLHSKSRSVSRGRVSILPLAMIAFSLHGVLSAFGIAPVTIAFWAVGIASAVGFGTQLGMPSGVTFSSETQSFFVPGSWLPLVLLMAIFFTRYAVGIILARRLAVAGEAAFVGAISLCYGFFSGLFLARAIVTWRAASRRHQNHLDLEKGS